MRVLVTGGCGFIGSAVVRSILRSTVGAVINLDAMTYAATPESVASVGSHSGYRFVHGDITDASTVRVVFEEMRPDAVIHLAAESHVDRSIDGPGAFVKTNVIGTFVLLDEATRYWRQLSGVARDSFRFLHVSTDEVFGALGDEGAFDEDTPYDPRSPYSATKAGSDHLVRAWHHTYGLPTVVTNCSNNYGPYQFPEKLIPLTILKCLARESIPVYGTGANVRDWLFVEDHAAALLLALEQGRIGRSYNLGGRAERTNLDVVQAVCDLVDEQVKGTGRSPSRELITFVRDRPGHDFRYAMDPRRAEAELGWAATETFESGLRKTIEWYVRNRAWWERIASRNYDGHRLGQAGGQP